MDHSKILGSVLAGGKSQRFGEDKSQVQIGDKLLIDYVSNPLPSTILVFLVWKRSGL